MAEDVLEPLARYRDEYRAKFAHLVREKFADLVAAAGIDIKANRALAFRIHVQESAAEQTRSWQGVWTFLAIVGFLLLAVALVVACLCETDHATRIRVWMACALGGVLGCVLGVVALVFRSRISDRLATLEDSIRRDRQKAWQQMAPLNALYTWDLIPNLIEAAVPRLAFDPYLTARRLVDLKRLYGWDDSLNEGRSVVFAQSGVINGNPFLFGDLLEQNWGEKTYSGSITIYWTEVVEDDEGHTHTVPHCQVLTASVTKPIPVYAQRKILVYGNDAAPNLTFTHRPNELSTAADGLWTRWKKHCQFKKLEEFAHNLEDESQYTLMANHEFETLFNTPNRNDEVEFRLLFTPLAQQQMLELMKDTKIGYGDDFTFDKIQKINILRSRHLDAGEIDTDPARFHHWELDEAARTFYAFSEKYFKDVYFALAPLLAIPLYQQTRTHEEIWKGVIPEDRASFWEHESLANYYGDDAFRHPASVTQNILKTACTVREDGTSEIRVTAHGFRTEKRVDYEEMWGGDGDLHTIPIEWDEYLPVEQTRGMCVAEAAHAGAAFESDYASARQAVFRRALRAYLFS